MLMYPIFISHDPNGEEDIPSMPGIKRWGVNKLSGHLKPIVDNGLGSVLIFGVPSPAVKDETGSAAEDPKRSPVIPAVQLIRASFPSVLVACDVCLCTWTSHGHCGLIPKNDGQIDIGASTKRLAEIAVAFAKGGCQVIAPSDMMDGRVLAIKSALKAAGLGRTIPVLSYSSKFASCLYGPFRDAAGSAPTFGDRRTYQLPSGSAGLAIRAADRDVEEGADMLMVKPGIFYLDIIAKIKSRHPHHPLFAYQVSGEYSMIMKGAESGLFNLDAAVMESLHSFRRAGTDVVISYFTPRVLEALRNQAVM